MAAKKKAKSKAGKATAKKPAKKAGAKKVGTKKPAKKATAKKATARKPAGKKAGKKAATRKAKDVPAGKQTAAAKATPQSPAAAPSKPDAAGPDRPKSGFSSLDVNMGHVFALRPRVATSFRPDDFRLARQQLEVEAFASADEASRAVAERALELTHGDAMPGRKPHQRRF